MSGSRLPSLAIWVNGELSLSASTKKRETLAFRDHFIVKPSFPWWESHWHSEKGGTACADGFYYGSDNNTEWVDDKHLGHMIAGLDLPEAKQWAVERGLRAET